MLSPQHIRHLSSAAGPSSTCCRGRAVIATLILVLTVLVLPPDAAKSQDRVDKLKSVYLYNFGNYVTWPAEAFSRSGGKQAPFSIGILAESHPAEAILKAIARKKKIGSRRINPFLIRDIRTEWTCQILYIPSTTPAEVTKAALERIRDKPVLVVTEVTESGDASAAGMINFYLAGTSIKFQIDPKGIIANDMKPSSKLIQLGDVIERRIVLK